MATWEVGMSGAGPFYFKMVVTITQSGNTANVECEIFWRRDSYGYSAYDTSADWSITIDGTKYTGTYNFSADAGGGIGSKSIASRTKGISHAVGAAADSITIAASFSTATSSAGSASQSHSQTLARIPYPDPGQPGVPSGISNAAGNLDVDWGLATGRVTLYRIAYRPVGSSTWLYTTDTAPKRYLSGLNLGVRYELAVRAENEDGVSAYRYSTGSGFLVQGGNPKSAPTMLIAVPTTIDSATFSFNPTNINDGGSPILEYILQTAFDPTTWDGQDPGEGYVVPLGSTSYTVNFGVDKSGMTVYGRMWARNAYGDGPASGTVSGKLKSVPGAPGRPSISGIGTHGMQLNWTAPTDTGGYTLTHYHVYRSVNPTMVPATEVAVLDPTTLQYVADSLLPAQVYFWTVAAENALGVGAQSAVSAVAKTLSGIGAGSGAKFVDCDLYFGYGGYFVNITDIRAADGAGHFVPIG